jgi:hypothetical protein
VAVLVDSEQQRTLLQAWLQITLSLWVLVGRNKQT